ncbi:MAG: TolC family protein [Xanthomonadales bacterium]|jgi:outer membrane protein TolC|nr:TolC family protein [Xanthomonadales bacterium]
MKRSWALLIFLLPCGTVRAVGDWTHWVDRAWSQDPQAFALASDADTARSLQREAQRWFAGPAELELSWLDDQRRARLGSAERELSLTVPLWQPGEQAATRQLADLELSLRAVQGARHREALARQLIECALRVDLARQQRRQRRTAQAWATDLAARTATAVDAGERAPLEHRRAESERARADQALAAARRELREARACWWQWTGSDPPAPLPDIPARPPLQDTLPLQVAQAELAVAEARLQQLETRRVDSPTLGLHWGAERDGAGERWDERVGVALAIPLGATSAQRRERVDAIGDRETALRALQQARRLQEEARRRTAAARRDAEREANQAAERVRLLQEVLDWTARAYTLGEIGLTELLAARREHQAAVGEAVDSRNTLAQARYAEAWARGWRP